MTRDEAIALIYPPIQNALETAHDQDWCVSHAVHLATEAAATVIQQAFAERDGEIERLTEALQDIVADVQVATDVDAGIYEDPTPEQLAARAKRIARHLPQPKEIAVVEVTQSARVAAALVALRQLRSGRFPEDESVSGVHPEELLTGEHDEEDVVQAIAEAGARGVQQGLDMARDEQRATPTTAACCLIGPWGPAEDKSAIRKLGGDDASNAK